MALKRGYNRGGEGNQPRLRGSIPTHDIQQVFDSNVIVFAHPIVCLIPKQGVFISKVFNPKAVV
jgi:hypothetical protein